MFSRLVVIFCLFLIQFGWSESATAHPTENSRVNDALLLGQSRDQPYQQYNLSRTLRNACPVFRSNELGYKCYDLALRNLNEPTETSELVIHMCEDPDHAFRRRCLREAFEEYDFLLYRFDIAEGIVNACLHDNVSPTPFERIARCYLQATLHSGSSLINVVREACKEGSNPQQVSSCFTRALNNFPSNPENNIQYYRAQTDFLTNLLR